MDLERLYAQLLSENASERREAARQVVNIASGTQNDTSAVVQSGCIQRMVECYGQDEDYDISVMYALANVAGEVEVTGWLLEQPHAIRIILEGKDVKCNAVALSNLAEYPLLSEDLLKEVARAIAKHPNETEILRGMLHALYRYESVDSILEPHIPKVVELAKRADLESDLTTLAIMGTIAEKGTPAQIQSMLDAGCMEVLVGSLEDEALAVSLRIMGDLMHDKIGREAVFGARHTAFLIDVLGKHTMQSVIQGGLFLLGRIAEFATVSYVGRYAFSEVLLRVCRRFAVEKDIVAAVLDALEKVVETGASLQVNDWVQALREINTPQANAFISAFLLKWKLSGHNSAKV